MGFLSDLFGGKELRLAAENELTQKLAKSPLLEALIETIMTSETQEWIRTEQGSKDDRRRRVIVTRDGVEYKWYDLIKERTGPEPGDWKYVEDIHGEVFYDFHDSGYAPLGSYSYDAGKKEVPIATVCLLFAQLLREQMMAKMPKASFDSAIKTLVGDDVGARFDYRLPDRELRSIF